MAKILPGLAVAKMSGTILGTTYQNWRGILVARSKPTPTNVNTPRQSIVRSILSGLATAWRDVLNAGQRQAWNNHASNYSWKDVFGGEIKMTGQNLYIKQNFHLIDNSRLRQDTPTPDVSPSELTAGVVSVSPESFTIEINDAPVSEVNSQSPFLSVEVAGGFMTKTLDPLTNLLTINTQGLPAGRVHQKSDYRLTDYINEAVLTPAVKASVNIVPTILGTRNMSVVVRRFNKYGNFSSPLVLNGLTITA